MKNYYLLLTAILIFSCTTSENVIPEMEEDIFVTAFTSKEFFSNGAIKDSVYYTLNNDKIVDYSGFIWFSGNHRTVNKTYNYTGNNLSETIYFYEDELHEKDTFTYDDSENLLEVNRTHYQQPTLFNDRYAYTHTNDTIYRARYRTYDDGLTEDIITESKYVFDANDNLIYYDIYSYSSYFLTTIEMNYDTNDNMLLESRTFNYPNVVTYTNTFTYDYSSLNTLFEINKNSFGKKNYILFHYFDLIDTYWRINTKNICKNSMSSYASTYEDPIIYTFEFSNELGEDDYAQTNTYKTFILGDFYTDNIIEYVFN
ncbi:hypothetical protein [uncultured Psychroserpens sp.]|uniref:hypothetical protein n=1 Tax=uncultured Psychroserpens sp. TaxID=255436 RepID=UPI002623E435|nr:hypothetical protein [uncultured Psychroserpens sp.]